MERIQRQRRVQCKWRGLEQQSIHGTVAAHVVFDILAVLSACSPANCPSEYICIDTMNAQFPSLPSKRNSHGQHPVVREGHGQREATDYRGFDIGHEQSLRRFSPGIGTYAPFFQPKLRGHHPLRGWAPLLLGEDRRTQSAFGRNTHRARIGRI